jgi:hypothetical protein
MLQLAHQSGVHQDDEVHVPGLALSVPELTLAHAQMQLPVPVKGLCPSPASLVDLQDAVRFPIRPIADQDFRGCLASASDHSTRMRTGWLTLGMRIDLVKYHWV